MSITAKSLIGAHLLEDVVVIVIKYAYSPSCLLVSFDLESTGLQVFTDQITEIGAESAVLFDDESYEFLHRQQPSEPNFQTYVKCTRAICLKSQKITGITEETLARAPNIATAMNQFAYYINNDICKPFDPQTTRILVAYNGTKFDLPMCIAELEHAGISASKFMRQLRFSYLLDPLLMARDVVDTTLLPRDKDGKPCFRLGGVYEALCGKPLIGAHGALADSSAVLKLLLEQECFKQALLKDLVSKSPKYLCNIMNLVTQVVQSIPKVIPQKQNEPKQKKTKTLLQFYQPIAKDPA